MSTFSVKGLFIRSSGACKHSRWRPCEYLPYARCSTILQVSTNFAGQHLPYNTLSALYVKDAAYLHPSCQKGVGTYSRPRYDCSLQVHGRPRSSMPIVRTDHARVPGFAKPGVVWSPCSSLDMPTSHIFAFRKRSRRTARAVPCYQARPCQVTLRRPLPGFSAPACMSRQVVMYQGTPGEHH